MPKSTVQMNKALRDHRESLGLYHFQGWAKSQEEAQRLSKLYKGPLLREQPKDYEIKKDG